MSTATASAADASSAGLGYMAVMVLRMVMRARDDSTTQHEQGTAVFCQADQRTAHV